MRSNFITSHKTIRIFFFTLTLGFIHCGTPMHQAMRGPFDHINEVVVDYPFEEITEQTASTILSGWTQRFVIPNPLTSQGLRSMTEGSRDAPHQGIILVEATLFGDIVSEAYLFEEARKDSLDSEASRKLRDSYHHKHRSDIYFRVHLTMDSSFSELSLKLDNWAIYLIDSDGIIYEPSDISEEPIGREEKSFYSRFIRADVTSRHFILDADLYFPKKTFSGKNLFGIQNDCLILVFSRNKEDVARVAWIFKDREKK